MLRPMSFVVALVLSGGVVSACGGSDADDAAATTTPTTVEPTATAPESDDVVPPDSDDVVPPEGDDLAPPEDEVEVVECSELEGPVNLAVQSVGCTVDGAPAPVSALPCDDGRTVLIAGDRYGIEGETWQPYDFGTGPPATELC